MAEQQTSVPPQAQTPVAPAPVMDVVAPPPGTASEAKPAVPKQLPQKPAPAKPSRPKTANQSVNTAIAATVVIVLGLALLAVYAYLAQKH